MLSGQLWPSLSFLLQHCCGSGRPRKKRRRHDSSLSGYIQHRGVREMSIYSLRFRANTLAPRTPYSLAVFSFFVPRKQSKWAVTRTSSNPRSPKNETSSASGRAPAIQPAHKSMLRRTSSPSSASSTISPSCSRPPGRNTRRISVNALSFSGTRLSTPLEINTSTLESGSGREVASAQCRSQTPDV